MNDSRRSCVAACVLWLLGACGDVDANVIASEDTGTGGTHSDAAPSSCTSASCLECTSHDDCSGVEDRHLCSAQGRCVECLRDSHCDDVDEICSPFGVCGVPCTTDDMCLFDDPHCDLDIGVCVECTSDDHCEPGQACRFGGECTST